MAICNPLDGDLELPCGTNQGGIVEAYFADFASMGTVTHGSPSDTITAIAMVGGAVFYKYEFLKNISTYGEETPTEQATGVTNTVQTVTLSFNKRQQTTRAKLALLGYHKNLACIVLDSNGKYWLIGETAGVNLTNKVSESGTLRADRNQYTLTFVGEEPEDASELATGVLATVI